LAKIRLPEKMKAAGIFLAGLFTVLFGQAVSDQESTDSVKISASELESKVMSTLMFGGSSPVSFSGEGRIRLQYHKFAPCPAYARADRSWTQAGWEGNEDMLRMGMVVRANRNTVLWSKIGFQTTLPGIYNNPPRFAGNTNAIQDSSGGLTREQAMHDKMEETAVVHEDMCAGLAIRTVPASFWLKMGSIIWTEASPLTIWKSQPRNVAWDFLPYEIEQPIARYYEYNITKGAKEGRASWHKKALQGINLESINLPWDLYFNSFYGICERYDSWEREFSDYSNDLAYTADWPATEAKGRGIGDTYHHLLHLRLAKAKVFNGMTLGLNYADYQVQDDLKINNVFWGAFFGYNKNPHDMARNNLAQFRLNNVRDTAFYKEPKIASVDIKGPLGDRMELQADLAMSMTDTTFIRYDTASSFSWKPEKKNVNPAFFGHVKSTHGLPAAIDVAFISTGFYSPLSFAAPSDAFYPFGSNLLGAGKFIARGEASPYAQNMAGAVIGVMPNLGNGHFKINYGQHFQVKSARDVVYFPYRLNGQDFFGLFHSSYNRWGLDILDESIILNNSVWRYTPRLGDESFTRILHYDKSRGPEAGGIRQDYLGTMEGFVPYESAAAADSNTKEKTSIYTRSKWVPQHRKFTFNLETDIAYDVGRFIGYTRELNLSFYGAINGISTSLTPIAFSEKNQLLWSLYLRFEPTISITNKLFIIGLLGYENWRSEKGWIKEGSGPAASCPIDYRDVAAGIGCDWDMTARAGLHLRAKWMRHDDVNFSANSWATPVLSSEIKMWF
jgi:hypothetical protein